MPISEKVLSPVRGWRQLFGPRITILRLLLKISWPLSLALLLIVLVAGLLPIVFVIATGVMIGAVPEALQGGFDSPAGRTLVLALVIAAAIFLAQQVFGPFQEAITETLARRLDGYLRARVMGAVSKTPGLAHLEDPRLLDEISIARGVGPAQYTPGGALSGLTFQIFNYIQGLLATLLVASFNWFWALVILGYRLFSRRRGRQEYLKMIQNQTGQAKALRRSDYFRDLALRPGAAKETRVFGLADWVLDRFSRHWLEAMADLWRQRWKSVRFFVWSYALSWIPHLAIFVLIARAGLRGEISLGQVAMYTMGVFAMRSMGAFGPHDQQLEFGLASIPAVLKLEQTTAASRVPSGDLDPSGRPRSLIRLEGLRFTYPGSSLEVLSGVDLDIEAGKSLAIVGANGAGKTTLVKLLCRFYDPTGGRITVDRVDLKEFRTEQWQQRVAAIFQDFVKYDLPVRENIGFGDLSRLSDVPALEAAARLAGADSVVESLPNGWETILSREYTNGAELSGGQWQRIALARAMLAAASRPALLILDEPTANLDVRAEAEIYDRFFQLTQGLTTIVISHRFSTVRQADRICVLESGVVAEKGTHEGLLALGGRYAEMFRLQASKFLDEVSPAPDTGGETARA